MSLIHANWSDLQIIRYTLLENNYGDRYAQIRVKNIASGGRIVDSRYFIATLMDAEGTRVKGVSGASNIRIDPGETKMVTIYFGRLQWPIAKIEAE